MISAAALTGAHHSQSQRRSLYPPPLPSRSAAAAAASCPGGSSSSRRSWSRYPGGSNRSQTAMLYEELCAIRSTSAHFRSRIDAIVDDQRQQPPAAQPFSPAAGAGASSWSQQRLARPSYSMPGRLDLLTPNGNISAGPFSPGSTTTTSPHLRGSSLAYASSPSLSQPQQAAPFSSANTIPGLPSSFFSSSASNTSGLPDLPGGSIFANAPPQVQDPGHGSVLGFAAFAQASSQPPLLSHHLQSHQPWNLLSGPSSSSSSWSPSSSDNNVVPSSWTWGNTATSGTTTNGFVMQPPLSSVSSPSSEQHGDELPPLPPSLQLQPPLLLPVKQEPSSSNNASLDPELIYIDSDDEPFDLDTLMASLESSTSLMASLLGSNPGLKSMPSFGSASSSGDMQFQMGGTKGDELTMMSSSWGAQTWSSSPVPEDVVNGISMMSIDGGSSSAADFGSMAWTAQTMSSMPSLQQQLPWQQGGTLASSSSDLSQQFMQPAGFDLPPLLPSMDMGNSTHVMQYGRNIGPITWNAGNDQNRGAMKGPAVNCDAISGSNNSKLWQSHSSSTGSSSVAIPKLRLGGMESRRVRPPSSLSSATAASSSMSRSGANGNLFTDVEMERLMKDKRLKELVNTDPNRVKRYICT